MPINSSGDILKNNDQLTASTPANYLERQEFYKTNKRPKFSIVENQRGDEFPECSDYFRNDNPLFVGRTDQLLNLYKEIAEKRCHVIVGAPGIGKTTLALAYVHSYGSDEELYPGGVFWFELNKPEPTTEAVSRRFARYFSIHGEKEDILFSQLQEAIKKIHNEGKRILFIFDDAGDYDSLEKYIKLLRGTHHHLIITSIYRDWGTYKARPMRLKKFTLPESYQFIARHLAKNSTKDDRQILIKQCHQVPQLLRKIICHVNTIYSGILKTYLDEQKLKTKTLVPSKLLASTPRLKRKENSIDNPKQFADIHRLELASTLKDILSKHPSSIFKLLAVGVFFNSNCISKELFPLDEELPYDPLQILYNISLLERVGRDYKIPFGIHNAIRTILEHNQDYLTETSKQTPVIKIEKAFITALSIIEPKLPPIYEQNCAYNYRKYEAYIPHAQALAKAANKYNEEFPEIKAVLPRVANLLLHSAYAYFRQGLLSEAESIIEGGLELAKQSFGGNTKEMITYYRLYARILAKQNKLDIAEPLLRRAIDINLQNCDFIERPKYSLEHAIAHGYLGLLLTNKGADFFKEAEFCLTKALETLRQTHWDPKLNNARQYYLALTMRHLGEHLTAKGEYNAAIKNYEQALEICGNYFKQVISSKENNTNEYQKYPLMVTIQRRMCVTYYLLGRYSKAEEKLNWVIKILTELHGTLEHEEILSSTTTLAKILFWRGNYKDAQKKFDAIANSHFAKCKPLSQPVIDVTYYQGRLLAASGHYREARSKFVEALIQQQKYCASSKFSNESEISLSNPNSVVINTLKSLGYEDYQRIIHLKVAKIIHYIGFSYYKLRQYNIAKDFYAEALIINEKISTKHPKAFLSNLGFASVAFQQGKYHKTERILKNLLEKQKNFYEENKNAQHFDIGNTHRFLAKLYIKKAQFPQATEHIKAANKIWEELKQKENCILPEMILTLITQGYLAWYAEHDYSTAENLFRKALEEQEKLYVKQSHPNIAQSKARLGRIRYFQGDYIGAAHLYLEAKQIFEHCFDNDERKSHSLLAHLNYYIGEIYYQCWLYLDFSTDSIYKEKANSTLREAQSIFGEHHPENVPILCALSRIAVGRKAGGTAYMYLTQAKTILEKTFDKDVLANHPQFAMIQCNFSKLHDWDNNQSLDKFCYETIEMLTRIYNKPLKMHPRMIELFANLLLLRKSAARAENRAKMITCFYARHFNKEIDVNEATEHFQNDFSNRKLEDITNIGLLIDLQHIVSSFGLDVPISELNEKVVECIANNLRQVLTTPLFVEKPQRSIYVLCDSNTKILANHLETVKQLGKLLAENDLCLVCQESNSIILKTLVAGVTESKGKVLSIAEQNDLEQKNKIREAIGIIMLPGGLTVFNKLTEILANMLDNNDPTSSIPLKPIAVWNVNNFYHDHFRLVLQQQITCSSTSLNISDLFIFSDNVSLLIKYINSFKLCKTEPTKFWLVGPHNTETKLSSSILQAKLPGENFHLFLEENCIDHDPDHGFSLLNATRVEVKNKLLTLKNDLESRQILSEEISDAIIARDIFADDSHCSILRDNYYQKQRELAETFKNIQESFTPLKNFEFKDLDRVLIWLNSKNFEDEARLLMNKRLAVSTAENDLKNHCQQPHIFQRYAEKLANQLYLGYKSAILYAKSHINLYIWKKIGSQSNELMLLTKHETYSLKNSIHILLINEFTHLNRLSVISSDHPTFGNTEIVPEAQEQKTAWNTSKVLAKLETHAKNSKLEETSEPENPPTVPLAIGKQTDLRDDSTVEDTQQMRSDNNNESSHAFFLKN